MTQPNGRPINPLYTTAALMMTLATIVGLGSVITGVAVGAHTIPNCGVNPYSDDGDVLCTGYGSSHPFVGVGVAVALGGLVLAAILAALCRIAFAVGDIKRVTLPSEVSTPIAVSPTTTGIPALPLRDGVAPKYPIMLPSEPDAEG